MPEVAVECPLCGETIEITAYNAVTKSDAIVEHLKKDCIVNKGLPNFPTVGPPLPKALGIRWPWKGGS